MTAPEPIDETMPEMDAAPVVPDSAGRVDSVPLDLLSQPDEQEAMTPPAVGDKVAYSKEGTVTAINGGTAIVSVTHVNGQALPGADEPDGDEATDPMEGLEREAQAMDDQNQMG